MGMYTETYYVSLVESAVRSDVGGGVRGKNISHCQPDWRECAHGREHVVLTADERSLRWARVWALAGDQGGGGREFTTARFPAKRKRAKFRTRLQLGAPLHTKPFEKGRYQH